MDDILKNVLKHNERYCNFKVFDNPIKFSELFKDQNIDLVQVHLTQLIHIDKEDSIIGFAGVFSWANNELTPEDGDTYNPNMSVYGYEWFKYIENNTEKRGLDILVGDDW